jgi:signal transduction histidine kinase
VTSREKSELVRSTEQRVRKIFEAAGHEVSEAVDERPGEVVFFADEQRRTGRLRMHWVVWEQCPENFEAALEALDQERARLGADRAMAVIAYGYLPEGYHHDIHAHHVNAFTVRRLTFELLGVFEFLRRAASPPPNAPHHPDQFLPRWGTTERGQTVSAVEHIDSLLALEGSWLLYVTGTGGSGRTTLMKYVLSRRAQACLANPDHIEPVLDLDEAQSFPPGSWSWALPRLCGPHEYIGYAERSPLFFYETMGGGPSRLIVVDEDRKTSVAPPGSGNIPFFQLRLRAPHDQEIHAWYRIHLPEAVHAQFEVARDSSADFAAIASHLINLSSSHDAAVKASETSENTTQWIARFVISYASQMVETPAQRLRAALFSGVADEGATVTQLEDGALEEFALGNSRHLARVREDSQNASIAQWVTLIGKDVGMFANRLLRDYFLARKIVREVREHGPDIFARYQFPQEHVLLFLAVIAPDVAAQAAADRSAEMRERIQEEVENRLQLTLAHQLKRSVGALSTNFGRVRKILPETVRAECSDDLRRIDDELAFLSALAEKTRRWHEVPEEPRDDIAVLAELDGALSQLREAHAEIEVVREVAPDMLVRAGRHTLHEILYCLLENAFHAASDPAASQPPRVEVHAVHEGADVVRIEVIDSGPGVDPGDRERIFEPRVTTKKGGAGRPLGTGMGLAIARKYAHAIGGRVEMDLSRPQTCFVLKLVAGGMNRG